MSNAPSIAPSQSDPEILRASGDWTLRNATQLLAFIEAAPERAQDIDGRDITQLDSTGAMLLSRYAVRVGLGLATVEVQSKFQSLVESVREICLPARIRRPADGDPVGRPHRQRLHRADRRDAEWRGDRRYPHPGPGSDRIAGVATPVRAAGDAAAADLPGDDGRPARRPGGLRDQPRTVAGTVRHPPA